MFRPRNLDLDGAAGAWYTMERKTTYFNEHGVLRTLVTDDDRPHAFHTYTEVEADAIIESVKRDRELHPRRSMNKLVARVPLTVMEQSIHEQWDEADWKRWLNDPDNAAFRVWQGRV